MDDIQRLHIELACERLIRQFALLNDAQDHQALAELFTPDGSFARPTDPDKPIQGRDGIREFFGNRPKRTTRHVMSNIVVDVQSMTRAHARSYVVLYSGERGDQVLVGDFYDICHCSVDGRWLFEHRRGSLAFDR